MTAGGDDFLTFSGTCCTARQLPGRQVGLRDTLDDCCDLSIGGTMLRYANVIWLTLAFIGCDRRESAFCVNLHVGSFGHCRALQVGCFAEQEPGTTELHAAERALEQAAKLRREIAELEQNRSKGKSIVVGEDSAGSCAAAPSNESQSPASPFSLAATSWLISLDIGREKGTWMPQSWGISGRRLEVDLAFQFLAGGEMVVDVVSPFIDIKVKAGTWSVGPAEGSSRRRTSRTAGNLRIMSDTCRFWLLTEGFTRGDVSVPPGKLYFAVPAWGGKLARRGLVTVRQRRWFVREESRILGVFGTERIEADASGRAQPGVPRPRLPPFASGFKDV